MLLRGPANLRKMSMSIKLAGKDARGVPNLQINVNGLITRVRNIALSNNKVRVSYGAMEAGLWRITNMSVSSEKRTKTGEISEATMELEFTLASDARKFVGPTSGGKKKTTSGKKTPPKTKKNKNKKPKTYTVKKGDTLTKIAVKFYSNAKAYKKIAKENKIKNPNKIRVGQKLKLP